MSTALELARRAVELFNRESSEEGRFEVLDDTRALFVDEPLIIPMRAALESVEFQGPDALDRFSAASRESWIWLRIDVERARELNDDTALLVGSLTGVGRESGVETSAQIAWLVETDGERIAAIRTFAGERQALEAAA